MKFLQSAVQVHACHVFITSYIGVFQLRDNTAMLMLKTIANYGSCFA